MNDRKDKKHQLRRLYRQRREAVPASDCAACGRVVASFVARYVAGRKPGTVFLYRSYGSEVPTNDLILLFESQAWTVIAPADNTVAASLDALSVKGADGWKVVEGAAAAALRHATTLILLPGLAWDARGGRLGQGGGYYDCVLPVFPTSATRIGVGFECQCLPDGDALPTDPWDIPVQMVVTENALYAVDAQTGVRKILFR